MRKIVILFFTVIISYTSYTQDVPGKYLNRTGWNDWSAEAGFSQNGISPFFKRPISSISGLQPLSQSDCNGNYNNRSDYILDLDNDMGRFRVVTDNQADTVVPIAAFRNPAEDDLSGGEWFCSSSYLSYLDFMLPGKYDIYIGSPTSIRSETTILLTSGNYTYVLSGDPGIPPDSRRTTAGGGSFVLGVETQISDDMKTLLAHVCFGGLPPGETIRVQAFLDQSGEDEVLLGSKEFNLATSNECFSSSSTSDSPPIEIPIESPDLLNEPNSINIYLERLCETPDGWGQLDCDSLTSRVPNFTAILNIPSLESPQGALVQSTNSKDIVNITVQLCIYGVSSNDLLRLVAVPDFAPSEHYTSQIVLPPGFEGCKNSSDVVATHLYISDEDFPLGISTFKFDLFIEKLCINDGIATWASLDCQSESTQLGQSDFNISNE